MTHTAITLHHYPKGRTFPEEIYVSLSVAKTQSKVSYPQKYYGLRRMLWGL